MRRYPRAFAGRRKVPAYVALHRAAFGSDVMTESWRRRTLNRPEYVPDLDWVAVAPDGRLAGFCVCWFAPNGPAGRSSGQVEPMGVGPEFHRSGLGRAMLTEGLQRLRSHGAEQTFVETDLHRNPAFALYEGVGFRVLRDVLVYRNEYGAAISER